jgi:outer membrane lipoprotein-sorting protein
MKRMVLFLLMISLCLSSSSQAAEVNVSSMAALQSAINSASSGDVIILANGTYLNSMLTIGKSNITVRAASPKRDANTAPRSTV